VVRSRRRSDAGEYAATAEGHARHRRERSARAVRARCRAFEDPRAGKARCERRNGPLRRARRHHRASRRSSAARSGADAHAGDPLRASHRRRPCRFLRPRRVRRAPSDRRRRTPPSASRSSRARTATAVGCARRSPPSGAPMPLVLPLRSSSSCRRGPAGVRRDRFRAPEHGFPGPRGCRGGDGDRGDETVARRGRRGAREVGRSEPRVAAERGRRRAAATAPRRPPHRADERRRAARARMHRHAHLRSRRDERSLRGGRRAAPRRVPRAVVLGRRPRSRAGRRARAQDGARVRSDRAERLGAQPLPLHRRRPVARGPALRPRLRDGTDGGHRLRAGPPDRGSRSRGRAGRARDGAVERSRRTARDRRTTPGDARARALRPPLVDARRTPPLRRAHRAAGAVRAPAPPRPPARPTDSVCSRGRVSRVPTASACGVRSAARRRRRRRGSRSSC
jgi:hypothetical protein